MAMLKEGGHKNFNCGTAENELQSVRLTGQQNQAQILTVLHSIPCPLKSIRMAYSIMNRVSLSAEMS